MKTDTDRHGSLRRHGWSRAIGIGLFAIGLARCFEPTLLSLFAQSNPPSGGPGGGPTVTLDRSSDVLREVGPSISHNVLNRAICVVVVPGVPKAAFIVGSAYGRGVISCRSGRSFTGPWSSPAMVSLEGGSGLQMGGQASDFVLLIMNKQVATSVLSQRIKIGSDVSASAGPDRYETETGKTADILTYSSRARGLFAGDALSGSTIRPNNDGNRALYGRDLDAAELVRNGAPAVGSARRFVNLLNQISPK